MRNLLLSTLITNDVNVKKIVRRSKILLLLFFADRLVNKWENIFLLSNKMVKYERWIMGERKLVLIKKLIGINIHYFGASSVLSLLNGLPSSPFLIFLKAGTRIGC